MENKGCNTVGCLLFLVYALIQIVYVFFIKLNVHENIYFIYALIVITTIGAVYFGFVSVKLEKEIKKVKEQYRSKEIELEKEYKIKEQHLIKEKNIYKNQIDKMSSIIKSTEPFSFSASLYTDMKSYIFDEAAEYLISKKHPAYGSAGEIKDRMKKIYIDSQQKYKALLYKVEFLLDVFPDLKPYMEDDQTIKELLIYKDYNELSEFRDKSKDYLTIEEWNKLDNVQRNQLALDRWIKSDKSKSVIGLMYEMYISHILKQKGHRVEEYGIKHGVSDLGRDIISYKNDWVYIYQCKNWSKKKEIHENIVCQLFGTVMEYKISHKTEKVKAYLIVTTKLSPMAEEFSKRLGIEVRTITMGDFPLIKCNINGTNKIYHLPFDQQYWRTEISKPGEFYAETILEAEAKGFRRAMKHTF